jgi:hypothetical protein
VTAPVVVTIEFYGVPRQRAGRSSLSVSAGTLRDALSMLTKTCPALRDILSPDGRISAHYLLSFDGTEFVCDLDRRLHPGERLLVMSADAGG